MGIFRKVAVSAAIASMALGAGTANAAAFITSITIKNAIPTWLQVAEVQIFSGATNVALAGTATGSSIYAPSSTADKAIDGNTGGNYYTDTIFHSGSPDGGQFLTITLAGPTLVDSFKVFGRTDGGSERDLYSYTLYNGATVVGTGTLDARETNSASAQVPAVPEPATWAMMLIGFGMMGFGLRSRRKQSVRVAYA